MTAHGLPAHFTVTTEAKRQGLKPRCRKSSVASRSEGGDVVDYIIRNAGMTNAHSGLRIASVTA